MKKYQITEEQYAHIVERKKKEKEAKLSKNK